MLSTLSNESIITARMTFNRKKEPMTTRSTQKAVAIYDIVASVKLYMSVDQPSRVIMTKIVAIA